MAFTERSAKARNAILEAAARRFAADGYDRTTIRAIARDAGVDASMVIRYFASKADLFYASAWTAAPARVDLPGSGDFAERYAEVFLEVWESSGSALVALLRAAPTRPEAVAQLQGVLDRQFLPVFHQEFPDRADIGQRAALILSQTLGLAYCRYLLRLEPLASMDRAQLQHAFTGTVRRYLEEPIAP
ncbi:TetR family transcriptional regulator [Micromonospora sp. WMMD998]|uniref:TetR/AcrR family transcriptional regulator n=1 Tax=Micromonospora sp. WMMD998 TaxID=3016092 RepID=UPI00249A6896|nr:TetR family transcriptional regulator [Micromonospora sp. WMMD998]WFE41143.1 TetR family transcriptional regulator [Micromonospora sp. WMMD998]